MRWLVIGVAVLAACTSVEPVPETTTTTVTPTTSMPLPVPSTVPATTTTTSWPYEAAGELDLGPLEPRAGHSVIWTGTEMIVWGGLADEMGRTGRFNDGAAFDPVTEEWRMIAEAPLSPRWYHLAAWTGEEMLVIGGGTKEAAAYNPVADSWREIQDVPFVIGSDRDPYPAAVWDGDELMLWSPAADLMATYNPSTDEWVPVEAPPLTGSRGALLMGGGHTFAFGNDAGPVPLQTAELVEGSWQAVPDVDLSTDEYNVWAPPHLAIWLDDRIMSFSDSGSNGAVMTYEPGAESWEYADATPMNGCEWVAPAIPMDNEWYVPSCGRHWFIDVADGTWTETDLPSLSDTRYAVWTGQEVLVWGSPCCFGTGGEPFRIAAWRFTP